MVVVVQPESQLAPGVGQAEEHLHVQALVAQSSVEALDVAVFDRPSGLDVVQCDFVFVSPPIRGLESELGAVVDDDPRWKFALYLKSVQYSHHA